MGRIRLNNASIRPIALCLFSHEDRILVKRCLDPRSGERFLRPIGGGIEFGEMGRDSIVRETLEELGERAVEVRYVGLIENLFVYDGRPGHELVLVYDGRFDPPTPYKKTTLPVRSETGANGEAVWLDLETIRAASTPLYPKGLMDLLSAAKTG